MIFFHDAASQNEIICDESWRHAQFNLLTHLGGQLSDHLACSISLAVCITYTIFKVIRARACSIWKRDCWLLSAHFQWWNKQLICYHTRFTHADSHPRGFSKRICSYILITSSNACQRWWDTNEWKNKGPISGQAPGFIFSFDFVNSHFIHSMRFDFIDDFSALTLIGLRYSLVLAAFVCRRVRFVVIVTFI